MKSVEEIMPAIKACLQNAEKLVVAAKASAVPGSYHIGFHLAVLALEEIGKSSMIFMDALNPRPATEQDRKTPLHWIDDHERKLFWAIWLPQHSDLREWQKVPATMDFAREIHKQRLKTLYVDPSNLNASPISEQQAQRLISLAATRLEMERLKEFRELDTERQALLHWFFAATEDPRLKPMIFSKGSLDKQAEFGDDFGAWMKWLRETFEEADRKSIELTNLEMKRVPDSGDQGWDDKFEVKIRLKSWSHSIRQNQFTEWNKGIEKIKLTGGSDRNELIITLLVPKKVATQELWNMGWQNAYVFVTALNIGTLGFFWWYLPEYVSRYFEKIRDVEHNSEVIVDRIPMLKIGWQHQALKSQDLNNVSVVYGFIANANQQQFESLHRYFRNLGLMAKNDIFFQFEATIVVEFIMALKDAMRAYGDWDGDPGTAEDSITAFFEGIPAAPDFIIVIKEILQLVEQITTNKAAPHPITLEHVGKAKVIFEGYIKVKAQRFFMEEMARFNNKTKQ
jgi:AbiV family abortive infection protein